MLGGIMESEAQGAMISYVKNWAEWAKAWSKVERAKARQRRG